ncbi:EF-hand domain-containing family member [Trichinella spiralis]|uniref:EF-hand domain-containing family member n=2 Tax=Trichinella spiralis TaxID=6334 RepID=A0ABR3KYJ4_TRISP
MNNQLQYTQILSFGKVFPRFGSFKMGKYYKRKRKFNKKSHRNKEAPERKVVDFSEQEVPRLCRELMTLNHCKLYKKNKKFPKQRFIQNKNEGDVEFLRRVNQVTHTLLEEEMFKIKFGMNDNTKQKCQKSIQQNSGYTKRKINPHSTSREAVY